MIDIVRKYVYAPVLLELKERARQAVERKYDFADDVEFAYTPQVGDFLLGEAVGDKVVCDIGR